jgi:XTP/dITP diphosphohydrolase
MQYRREGDTLLENNIWLATGNIHKVREAREVLSDYGIPLKHLNVDRVEIQSDDPGEIAVYSLSQLPDDTRTVAVEDAGLFIDYYGGFPGPYSSYALEKLDNPGILKLMEGIEERSASYHSFIGIKQEGETHVFQGTVNGKISEQIRGTEGFGYDPIFIPDEGDGRTFGEMSKKEKNDISHRARAFRALGEWFQTKSIFSAQTK